MNTANNCPNGTDLTNNLESWGMDLDANLDAPIKLPKLRRTATERGRADGLLGVRGNNGYSRGGKGWRDYQRAYNAAI